MSSTHTYFSNSATIALKPLPHNRSILHANIKIDIYTLKVFFNTECEVEKFPYEVQIFRGEINTNDTPFPHRKFLKEISQVDQFVETFQEWAQKSINISFDDLKFIDDIAILTHPHPEFHEVICNLTITKRPQSNYYDIGYCEVNSYDNTVYPPFTQLKYGYCETYDVTFYIRWFTQWIEHYHEAESQDNITKGYNNRDKLDPYLSWISDWKRM